MNWTVDNWKQYAFRLIIVSFDSVQQKHFVQAVKVFTSTRKKHLIEKIEAKAVFPSLDVIVKFST